MPVTNDPLKAVYNRWDRFLNDVSKSVGQDRELDELSNKLAEVKESAFADGVLTDAELTAIHGKMELIAKAYEQVAANRGYPVDKTLPTTKKSFEVYGENAQIHFQTFAGKEIKDGKVSGGLLGKLTDAIKNHGDVQGAAKRVAFDILTSSAPEIADSKVKLLRGELSRINDPNAQRAVIAAVRTELGERLKKIPMGSREARPISLEAFDAAVKFNTSVAVHKTELPAEVKGTNQLFPNRPLAGWEASVRQATKAGFDDVSKAGQLFIDDDKKFPPGSTKNVAVKLDLNLGREGTPSVSDPASTAATISELLERSKAKGKTVHLTVGDSSGGENIPLGRTSMDITKDTGNFHYALKAGLQFAAANGPDKAGAAAALAKIEACEKRSPAVYFGSKDDKSSSKAEQDAAVKAAAPWVKVIDYDVEGFKSVTPDLGPTGLAVWGTKEFQIAKPWAEADFRVHVARGLSTHTLAAWTGAQKGLIGLHGFGLRPADQSGDKIGQDAVMLFRMLGQGSGFAAMFARRAGVPAAMAEMFGAGATGEAKSISDKWTKLMADPKAGAYFTAETKKLADELERDQKGGMHQVQVFDKMRARTREILDKADTLSPGWKQHMWDSAHDATRFFMQNFAREPIRQVLPAASRDEQIGSRIGVLTDLPYQSDLVIQSQAKIGVGGGPDAYREVRDVGHVSVGTNEAAIDAVSWAEAKQPGNNWELNFPGLWATRMGHGPMNQDEITRL